MTQIEEMEKELAGLVAIRERSVGVDLKRVNYRTAELQNRIQNRMRNLDKALAAELSAQRDEPVRDFEEVAAELGIIDAEFYQLGGMPHIMHLKLSEDSYYRVVTVATRHKESYEDLMISLMTIFNKAFRLKKSALGAFMINEWAERGAGVALCHRQDNFSRKRGRIIAKGRLLKVLRQERMK